MVRILQSLGSALALSVILTSRPVCAQWQEPGLHASVGGFAHIPARYRVAAPPLTHAAATGPSAEHQPLPWHLTLETAYTGEPTLVSQFRARRGLALMTFLDREHHCMFFGLNRRGRPGLNWVTLRRPRQAASPYAALEQVYAEILALRRPTFPEAPGFSW